MKKTLIFMRTHIVTEAVLSEFLKLKNSNCGDCVLFIDNHTHFYSEKLSQTMSITGNLSLTYFVMENMKNSLKSLKT